MSGLRVRYSGAFYHIYSRGVDKRKIFIDDHDYDRFLNFLVRAWRKYPYRCYAYCLMPNHYHFFVHTPEPNVSQLMQWINARYVEYFNRRWDRVGCLFQGRFRSEVVDKESYGLELIRYIHLNPVRGQLVDLPENWKWSSYRIYTGQANAPEFMDPRWVLKQFGDSFLYLHKFTLNGVRT